MNKQDRQTIEQKVCNVLQKYDCYTSRGADVVLLAQELGFQITYGKYLSANHYGTVTVKDTPNFVCKRIIVNVNYKDKPLVIARLLAYYFLYYSKDMVTFECNIYHQTENSDVDFFARCLLMPEDIFKVWYQHYREMNSYDTTVMLLAAHFSLPENIIIKRLCEV